MTCALAANQARTQGSRTMAIQGIGCRGLDRLVTREAEIVIIGKTDEGTALRLDARAQLVHRHEPGIAAFVENRFACQPVTLCRVVR
jgi:hypothetical protein